MAPPKKGKKGEGFHSAAGLIRYFDAEILNDQGEIVSVQRNIKFKKKKSKKKAKKKAKKKKKVSIKASDWCH